VRAGLIGVPGGLRRQWDALLEPTQDPQPFDPVDGAFIDLTVDEAHHL
jgi:hypothetical protein